MIENYNRPLIRSALLLVILIGLIYSNTIKSPWFLDDYYNITHNPRVHLSQLSADAIKNAFHGAPAENLATRPIAYLTFALNWYWGKDDVTGYHVVNIAIHILAAIFLFRTLLLLFQTPNLKGRLEAADIYFVALLSAVLWSIHPIQIQAVTYIVQRMTSMATLFYIVGILYFLKARLSSGTRSRVLFVGLCSLFFLLGVATKNNAIILPISLLVLEYLFFRDLGRRSTQKQAIAILLSGILIVAAAGFFIFADGNPERLFKGYEQRPFTLQERLLTQPRVVCYYLSQIFYPVADRFSITYDFPISTSLLSPWTTLPSLLLVIVLISLAFWRIKKNPLLAFAILFFFGNHIIESSVIPLEMVFEHRNYLPSLFLFVPLAVGIKKTLDHYYPAKKAMFYFLIGTICAVVIGIGTSTYIRNHDWRSVKSLWEDARNKAPNSARPLQNLAWGYYAPTGQLNKAIDLYHKALGLQCDQTAFKYYSYNNLADIYFSKLQNYEKALDFAQKAIEIIPQQLTTHLLLNKSLAHLGRYDQATTNLERLVQKNPHYIDFYYLNGLILLKQLEYEAAYHNFRKCLQIRPETWIYNREIGISLTYLGNFERGYWFLKRAHHLAPKQTGVLLAIADNRIRAARIDQANEWVDHAIDVIGTEHVVNVLVQISEDPLSAPFSHEVVKRISRKLEDRSDAISKMGVRLLDHFQSSH